MAVRVTEKFARQHLPATTNKPLSNKARLAEIQKHKREIKKLLKRGEAVYVEHSATGGKLV